jgi:hypothetical protein
MRRATTGILTLWLVLILSTTIRAQADQDRQTVPGGSVGPVRMTVEVPRQEAHQTREELRRVLEQYPPSVSRILALDPSLLQNEAYLSSYPALVAFLQARPEVARDPEYYFGRRPSPEERLRDEQNRMWENFFQGLFIIIFMGMVVSVLIWLIRTALEHRRWHRVSRTQTELHTKLLERFASHEELLTFLQSPAGREFLERASVPLHTGQPQVIAAPVSRILWAVQAGLVLALAGATLLFLSPRVEHVGEPLLVVGGLALAIGIGFVLSAVIAYLLSARLGLFESLRPASRSEAGTGA